ncbi:MAG: tetratricopeptide repeat protein [Thermodesulfobacteriota bacterium]
MLLPETTLLVDEDESRRVTEAALLREIGLSEVLEAGSGTEAWYTIKSFAVDLVVCAWGLSREMSGLVLLKVVRADASYATTPFLLMVDQVTRRQVMEAGQAGVTDVIVRPFTKETLRAKVELTLQANEDLRGLEARKLYEQGLTMTDAGRYEEALRCFEKVQRVKESAEVYYNMGFIQTAQNRYEEALLAFRRATLINQTFAQAFQKMGDVYARLGQMNEARKCLQRAAEIYVEKNMDEEAEKAYLQALEINPHTPNIFNSLGILYRRLGRYEEAIRMHIRALKVSPTDGRIHYNLARSFLGARKLGEAVETLRRALSLSPDFIEAENLLRSIEMGRGLY